MRTVWNKISQTTSDPATTRNLLLDLVPALVNEYGDIAAEAAAEWYQQARDQEIGVDGWQASLKGAKNFPSQGIQDTIRWQAGNLFGKKPDRDALATFLEGAVDRWVHYAGRNSIIANTTSDPKAHGFAVVPAGKCCAWCAMIASRGFTYHSDETARASTHPDCDCEIIPGWGSNPAKMAILRGYDPETYYGEYKNAVEHIGDDPSSSRLATVLRQDMNQWWPKEGIDGYSSYSSMLGQLSPNGLPSEVREHAITTLMRYQNPDEYTDGTHWENKMVGNLQLGSWQDYRSSLAQRYIASSDRSWKMPPEAPSTVPDDWPNDLPVLRVKELNHILYGSEKKIRGQGHGGKPRIRYAGGHMSGYGWIADRSEFPVVWDKNDIIEAAKHVLETVKPTKNGTYFGEYNGFHLYVSTEMRKGKIRITTITPNVRRRME